MWAHLLPIREYCGWEIGESSSSVYLGAGTSRVLRCQLEMMDFVFFLSWLPWGVPGIFDDESEEDKKQDRTHIWNQTPNGAEPLVSLSHCAQTDIPGPCRELSGSGG